MYNIISLPLLLKIRFGQKILCFFAPYASLRETFCVTINSQDSGRFSGYGLSRPGG